MDIIHESASNFFKLKNTKYHFIFVENRKKQEVVLDFFPSDYRHATGLHHITDIVIENNPVKLIDGILNKNPPEITDITLERSKKYKDFTPRTGSVKERISDIRFIEECLDTSDFIRKREESDNYVIVSFFRKRVVFKGISTYWLLKEKISGDSIIELYRVSSYKD